MNTITIAVLMDRKAALLKGLVVGDTAEIAVSPADMSAEIWAALVGALDMSKNPPVFGGRILAGQPGYHEVAPLADPTVGALVEGIGAKIAEVATAKAEVTARNERDLAAWEADPIRIEVRIDYGYRWEKWEPAHISSYRESLPEDWEPRIAATLARIEPEIAAHNAPHLIAVETAKVAADLARDEAKKLAEAEAKVAAKIKYAARLESGYWEKETESYNERRHGSPWCAKVTFPNGAKPVYEWGESTGKWGKAGLLRVACIPGEVIAWGQKDTRRPDRSDHTIAMLRPDGSMETMTATEAYRAVTSAQKATA